jgi:hypothetical protein
MVHSAWDSLTIDMQHGMISLETSIQQYFIRGMSSMSVIPEYPPLFWMTAVAAILLLGIAKGGFGGGGGVIGTPLMSLVIPVADAAALLLILLIIIDLITVKHYRRHFHRQSLKYLLIGSIFGIIFGTLTFHFLSDNERTLKLLIGILALLYVAYHIFRLPQLIIFSDTSLFRPIGIFLGALSGFVSMLIHAGGPIAVIYLLPQKLPKDVYVGTLALFFTTVNLAKLVPYSALGLIRVGNITTILILSPICLISAKFGIYLNKRFDPLWFNRIVYVLLFLAGLQLIIGESLIKLLLQ